MQSKVSNLVPLVLAVVLAAVAAVAMFRRTPRLAPNDSPSSVPRLPAEASHSPLPEDLVTAPPPPNPPSTVEHANPPQEPRSAADLLASGDLLRKAATTEVLAEYQARRGLDAGSPLTSFLATEDRKYLEAAAERFGDDPRVQLAVLMNDPPPRERQAWLERFKTSDPKNALPNYLERVKFQGEWAALRWLHSQVE